MAGHDGVWRGDVDKSPPRQHTDKQFAASLMSDTKWRKLLRALQEGGLGTLHCTVKFVDVALPVEMTLGIGDLRTPHRYIDSTKYGPITFRSLEWIEVPRTFLHKRYPDDPGKDVVQDVNAIVSIASALGVYPVEMTPSAVVIRGYAPK